MSGMSYSTCFEAAPEGIHTMMVLEMLHQGKIIITKLNKTRQDGFVKFWRHLCFKHASLSS
jgi:hypothetical protein